MFNQTLIIMKSILMISAILLLGVITASFTGPVTITGRVTDDNGQPMPGVSIVVKGKKSGTVTDVNGSYSVAVGENDKILIFSFLGFRSVAEKIDGRKIINVSMEPELVSLDEMVVVGYGSARNSKAESYSMAAPSATGYGKHTQVHLFNNNFNTEGYAAVEENGFRSVRSNPLSTFSIDVDNASYSNIRRFINNGEMPPAGAVRIEEMINYFRYDYPEPVGEYPFSVSTELAVCPWNNNHHLLHVGLRGKSIDKHSLPPSNLVFLIDVSGSMNMPNKLPLLKSAFGLLTGELRPQDHVAIVVYAGAAGLVLESTPGNRKDVIMRAIDKLEAGGSTAGGAGLRLAYAEASENYIEGGNNRIILATDGDFNVGESGNGSIEKLVAENRSRGIFMTVLGFGMGNIKDDKMEIIADKGNGNYAYIDNLQEARRVLVKEFGGTLFTIAKDVKFQIEFNPEYIKSYRLIGYENRLLNEEDFNDDRKDAGEMGAGHNVTALYELVPAGSEDDGPSVDPLRYQQSGTAGRGEEGKGKYKGEYLTIKLRYKEPEGMTSRLFEKQVRGYINDFSEASDNLRFAAAVSEFGMILGNSEFKGNSSLGSVISIAGSARGRDEEGYRAEFIRLASTVKSMRNSPESE